MPHKKRGQKNHVQVKKILAESEKSFIDKKKFDRIPRKDDNFVDRKREERILNDESDDEVRPKIQRPTIVSKESPIPKKSRKNKYILLKHPELKDFVKTKAKRPLTEVEETSTEEPSKKQKTEEKTATICDQLESHVIGSRFRYLNEKLYTSTSQQAKQFFDKDPQSFHAYHQGYSLSMDRWPSQPLDEIIEYIRKRPNKLTIADLGCGDARLARTLKATHPNIHSFDLMPLNEHVQVCDIAHTPLQPNSVDLVVFCLSLMGTNLTDFIFEAHRILRLRGTMKIVEIASRFDNNPEKFIKKIESIGFQCSKTNVFDEDAKKTKKKYRKPSKYFFTFDFVKISEKTLSKPIVTLLPCLHKKR